MNNWHATVVKFYVAWLEYYSNNKSIFVTLNNFAQKNIYGNIEYYDFHEYSTNVAQKSFDR